MKEGKGKKWNNTAFQVGSLDKGLIKAQTNSSINNCPTYGKNQEKRLAHVSEKIQQERVHTKMEMKLLICISCFF